MPQGLFGFVLSGILAALYLMLAYLATQRGAGFGRTTLIMIFYAIIASIWELGAAYLALGNSDLYLVDAWGHVVGVLFLNVLILAATVEFINQNRRFIFFVGAGAVWSLFSILLMIGIIPLAENIVPVIFWMIFIGSELLLFLALWVTANAVRKIEHPVVLRRVRVWLLALVILVPADMITFLYSDWVGDLLRFASVIISGVLVFIQTQEDLLWTTRRIFSYWLSNAFIFVALAIMGQFRTSTRETELGNLTNLFLDGFFAFYLFPLVILVAGIFNRSFFGLGQDQGLRVRSFASVISTKYSLIDLAETVVDELSKTFVLEYANLIVVDRQEGKQVYQLRTIVTGNLARPTRPIDPGALSYDNPLVRFFVDKKLPIESSDVAWLRFYEGIPNSQRTWLGTLPFELFVPVVCQEHLVGILALGPKKSLERFYPADRALVGMMAEQLAPVLDNVRLLDNTLRLNLELKTAQDEIISSNKKLRELDEMKSAFIGVITHELRTPLANIQFSSQVLEMYFKKIITAEQKRQFDELTAAVKTARSMIDNLINLAAFLNEKVTLNVVEFDFNFLLREALTPLKASVDSKKLRLQVNMIGDRFYLHADQALLKEAVIQMVSNAIKFTQTGGVRIVCWTTAESLCFDVEDTGIGIEEGRLNQVWDAFTQIQADSVKRGLEGLGLGLALVKYIVQLHGGHVWVESTVGSGSIFGFQIPLTGPAHPLPELAQRPKRLVIPKP